MAEKTFTCTVLTPERGVLETEATFAAIPAYDGEIGILRDRAPLLCRLAIGIVRLQTPEGLQNLFVDSGFAEVVDNKLTILTEEAASSDEIDSDSERAGQEAARNRNAVTPEEQESRRRDIARAAAKLKLANK